MSKTTVKINLESSASSIFQVSIDDHIVFKVNHPHTGTISVDLEKGKKHILIFYVQGQQGESYSIEVTEPVNPPKEQGTLDGEGKDYGFIEIDLTNE